MALALLALLLLASSGPASAAPYANAQFHYRFEYPDGWSLQARDGIDVAIKGPSSGGFQPNIVAQHEDEPNASEDTLWLQTYVQNSFLELSARVNLTVVQSPRTFTTASGRLAADYTFDQQAQNLTVRQRQVFFASQEHRMTYWLTFTDKSSTFQSRDADWQRSADTFTVEGSGSAGSWLMQPAGLALLGAVAATSVVAVAALKRRRGRSRNEDVAARARP